jgi:soluble lytic murein transglycosylase-like protein
MASGSSALWTTNDSAAPDPTTPQAAPADGLVNGATWASAAPGYAQSSDQAPADSIFGAVERGFSALTGFLQREFGALERQFSGALSSLFDGSPSAGAKPSPPAPARSSAATPSPYDGIIQQAAVKNQLDPALITAVMGQESGFNADAHSGAGALGLMQLMPDTAKQLGVSDPLDPAQNVDGGARLLRSLLDQFGGRLDMALAAYNAGPAAVERYGGIPPYPETQAYVRDVMSAYRAGALSPRS